MTSNALASAIEINVVSADQAHCVATYEHVLLLCWRRQVTVSSLQAAREGHMAIMRRHPQGVGCLTVGSGTYLEENGLREAATLVRDTYKNVRWAACVISDQGFVASSARAGLTTVLSLAGQSSMVKVFRDLPAALTWQKAHPSGLGLLPSRLGAAALLVENAMRDCAASA